MLVLSRKKNESLKVNDDIDIIVVEIRGDKVRLGVELDRYLDIHRREVWEALLRNGTAVEANGIGTRLTVMLSAKAQQAVKKLSAGVEGSPSPSVLLEQILLKAAGVDQAADLQSNIE